ncbi:MAG: hypothetical protein GTO20_30470 [Candidatus Aminicenantes bacterium]|nr:hypothetical protein [Candidatus Aminicenantes bacterium]
MKQENKNPLSAELLKRDQVLVGNGGTYQVLKRVGLAGATALVYLVRREQDDRPFALKLMQPGLSPEMCKRFQDEMVNLQRLRRAEDSFGTNHIPRIVESSDLQQPATQELYRLLGSPFIIMDFAEGTDVNTLLMEKIVLNEAEVLEIIKQFAEVLYVIHSENLTYTDMKLSNLIWNSKTKHLMVIDWNVITENRLQEDAPKDRLRAAAYLYQMVTGVPIEVDRSGMGVADQKYRRLENFKTLSEGTRALLIKAFHSDTFSRHGAGGPQLSCTREFLQELQIHAERFKLSSPELILKGKNALKDRQWQEALEYLDLASRQTDIEEDPAQFAQLQEDLEKTRSEANKLGRNAFHSGHGRYMNGLFAEAREDFEKAMRDDPYDEEARFFAIASRFAIQVGEESFRELKEPLEECIRALLRGHLDLAGNALSRLPAPTFEIAAIRSLQAEIKVRNAVRKGQRLLREDIIDEAQEFFRSAYQERDRILYVEPLEENLGSLTELYHKVEELKQLYEEGEAYFKEERFHEAAWVFWKARGISQGSKLANKRYQCASSLDAIKKLLETGNLEQAMEKCSQASGRFGDEPRLMSLKAQTIDARCDQLRTQADDAYQTRKFDTAKEYILEILKWKPEDGAAKIKLKDVQKEISSGYQERIQERESKLRTKPSIEACEQAIRFVEKQGYQVFDEGLQFIKRAEELKERIALLSNELDDLISSGDLEAQLDVLNRASARNWLLRQGDPEQLKNGLRPKILEKDLDRICTHLKYCRPQEALDLCDHLLQSQLPEEKESTVEALRKKANRLLGTLKELNRIKTQKVKSADENEDAELDKLKLERDYLFALQQMKQIEPHLEAPEEIRKYEENQVAFLRDVENFVEKSRHQGHNCLSYQDFAGGRKISFRINETLSIFKEFARNGRPGIEKWQNWNREFNGLLTLLEKGPVDWLSNFPVMLEKLKTLVHEPRLKEVISTLNPGRWDEIEPDHKKMEALASFTNDSPISFWLYGFLEQELKIKSIWQAMNEDSSRAEELMHQYVGSSHRPYYEKALKTVREVESFIEEQTRLPKENDSRLELENLEELLHQAENLSQGLNDFSELRGQKVEKRLEDHISALRKSISRTKKALIKKHSGNLDALLKKLPGTMEDHILRLSLEDEAKNEIEKLKDFDQKEAGQFERRLNDLLDQLLDISNIDLGNHEDRKRLSELQRRLCERSRTENSDDVDGYLKEFKRDPRFKDVISRYRVQHANLLIKLKRRKKAFTGAGLEELFALREEFGEFPELRAEIEETRREIFRKENEERFDDFTRKFKVATTYENWQELKAELEEIEPLLLSESDWREYQEMAVVIENHLMVRELLDPKDVEKYLETGDNEQVAKWQRALEWNVKERNRIEIPPLTKKNVDHGERNWLARGELNIESLQRLRWTRCLLQRLDRRRARLKPMQRR